MRNKLRTKVRKAFTTIELIVVLVGLGIVGLFVLGIGYGLFKLAIG